MGRDYGNRENRGRVSVAAEVERGTLVNRAIAVCADCDESVELREFPHSRVPEVLRKRDWVCSRHDHAWRCPAHAQDHEDEWHDSVRLPCEIPARRETFPGEPYIPRCKRIQGHRGVHRNGALEWDGDE